jgi:hypothetical protein
MELMDLYNYYSLDEVIDRKSVLSKLKQLKKEGKIDYSVEDDVVKIEDLDLDESETDELLEVFDQNDVFPYLDRDDEDEDDFGNFYDDEQDDY